VSLNRPTHGGNLDWAAAVAGCPPSLILDFSASINPLGPPNSAIAAIESGLKALSRYPDPNYSQLRQTLAEWHQLLPEWILPGNGSAELLTWAGWEFSQQSSTYLLTPAFGDYWRSLRTFSTQIRPCPLNLETGEWDFPGQSWQTAGLLLNNPHNPTGKLWTVEEILPYLDKFALVVVDEAFMDFLEPSQQQSLIPVVQDYPNLVILRSLTKFYSLPGLRLGYAIAHPDRLKRWQQWRDPWPVNVLAAAAGEAVIQDREFQEQTWDWLRAARSQLWQGLGAIESLQAFPGRANFLLVKTEKSSSDLQEVLLKKHRILIRDCLSFPELGDSYFRIAVRSLEENQMLLESLKSFL
jgi:L-threonine-O-3-phosphate decarboxylase